MNIIQIFAKKVNETKVSAIWLIINLKKQLYTALPRIFVYLKNPEGLLYSLKDLLYSVVVSIPDSLS
jgi:hypothetical protein